MHHMCISVPLAVRPFLSQRWTEIFHVHNVIYLSLCPAHKGRTGTDKFVQVLT